MFNQVCVEAETPAAPWRRIEVGHVDDADHRFDRAELGAVATRELLHAVYAPEAHTIRARRSIASALSSEHPRSDLGHLGDGGREDFVASFQLLLERFVGFGAARELCLLAFGAFADAP